MNPPPRDFIELVKGALNHLYDPAQLRDNGLIPVLFPAGVPAGVSRAQALHRAVLEAIGALHPGSLPDAAPQHRTHRLLELRYVDALPFREVMAELGLSQT